MTDEKPSKVSKRELGRDTIPPQDVMKAEKTEKKSNNKIIKK